MSEERESGTTEFQEEVGVLIVGAGPTRLTLAAQLHALGASVRIVVSYPRLVVCLYNRQYKRGARRVTYRRIRLDAVD